MYLERMSEVHDRIRDLCAKNDLSFEAASLKAGLSRSYLRLLFKKEGSEPNPKAARALAGALGTTPEWLLFEVDSKNSAGSSMQLSAALLSKAEENVDKLALSANRNINREQRIKLIVLHYEILYREQNGLPPLNQEEIALLD